MKKSTKGAVALAGAGLLLIGGTGSLAFWNASATVGGGTINSGELSLTDTTAGTCATATWTLDLGEDVPGEAFDPATDTIVPGDVITKTCTYEIGAVGNHLRADLTATGGAATGALAGAITPAATFTVAGAPATSITEANDGDVLEAEISLTFNPTSDNTTQLQSASLSDFVVSLQQAHN